MTRAAGVGTEHRVPLRVVVEGPLPGVGVALQLGRDGLQPPATADARRLTFDFELTRADDAAHGPVLRGPAAQGPPATRFVYLCWGRRAGDAASGWDRRTKIPLAGITAELLAARASVGGVLVARIAGTARDGGPACATVPLLGDGWTVDRAPAGPPSLANVPARAGA